MKRRIIVGLAMGVAVAAAVGAWRSAHQWHREPLDWSLAGTRDGGRVIVVAFLADYGPCMRDVRARLIDRGRHTVDVAVDAEFRDCSIQPASHFAPIALRVPGGVGGRAVRGESKSLHEVRRSPFLARSLPKVPDVRGLNVVEAAAVARAYGFDIVLGDRRRGPNRRAVARQEHAGTRLTVWFSGH